MKYRTIGWDVFVCRPLHQLGEMFDLEGDCPQCREKSLKYRIVQDDFQCLNCGAVCLPIARLVAA